MKKLIVFVLLLTACGKPAGDPTNIGNTNCQPLDYHNGVYYFPCNQSEFANGLSSFTQTHKGIQIVSIAGDGTYGHGVDRGYFVVTREQ